MRYLIYALIALATVGTVWVIAARKGTVDFGGKFPLYRPCEDEVVVPFRGYPLLWLTIVCVALSIAVQMSLYTYVDVLFTQIKLYGLFAIVLCAAVVDGKRRIIPNQVILFGFAFRAVMYAAEWIWASDTLLSVCINDLIGFGLGFGLLALVSLLTKGALGFGDVKLFGVIGIICGPFGTYSTLLAALLISLVVSLTGIITKKMGRKDAIPFGPCIAAGYTIALLLGSY